MLQLISQPSDFTITIFLLSKLKYIPGVDVHSNITMRRPVGRFYFAVKHVSKFAHIL